MKKRTTFYFLSGYLAFLCGLLLILIPLYYSTLSLFEQRQLSLTQQRLSSGLEQLEQQMESLHGIAFSIGRDAEYRMYARKDANNPAPADYYHLGKLHEEFSRLCLAQPFVEDYGLLMRNDVLFTRDRIHLPKDDYYGSFIRFGEMSKEEFFAAFGHPSSLSLFMSEMEIIRKNVPYQGMVWLCSMSETFTRNPSGVFFATFREDRIKSLLMPDLDDLQAGFRLSNNDGEVLMHYGLSGDTEKVHKLAASGGGLNAELILSETLFTSMMEPMRNMLLIFFGLLILAGVVLSVLLALRSGRPVRKLEAIARQVTEEADAPLNGFEFIGNTLTSLATSVDEYRQALTAQQISMRDQVFSTMLRVTPVKESLVSQQRLKLFDQCFPRFPAKYRLAVIGLQDDDASAENLAQRQLALLGLIESQLSPAPYVYTVSERAVLLLDCDSRYVWTQELAILRKAAREHFQMPLLIALSDESTTCEDLHTLHQQAKAILSLASQEANNELLDVWQSGNFPDQPDNLPLDYSEMSQLHSLLLHGEKAGALSLLCSIGSRMKKLTFLDDVVNRQLFYNIRSVLLRVKLERLEALSSLDIPDYHLERSTDVLLAQLSACCEEICDLITPFCQSHQAAFASSVCRFINEHLSDSSLSVGFVADHFAVSAPTLQKAIRQETGESFFDYVEQLRFDKALLLLRTTSLPIAQIAVECGFNSNNSFYKAFKRKSSLTPAVVRQQARSQQTDHEEAR